MAKSTLRLNNWNYLGGRIVSMLVGIGFGVMATYFWLTGQVGKVDSFGQRLPPTWFEQILAPLLAIGCFAGAVTFGWFIFRRYALSVEFGDQFRYRMVTGGGTKKWANVKNVKLVWEHDEDEHRSYIQVEIVLKGGKKIWVCVNETQAAKVEQFARSRFPELGVQFIDQT